MTIVVFTAAASEPLTIPEVMAHCRIDVNNDDSLLPILISSARAAAEQQLHRYLITQTLDAYFDGFPRYSCNNQRYYTDGYPSFLTDGQSHSNYLILLPPLQSVTSISYVDDNGATQTLAADQYLVDSKSTPARITPAYGVSWPTTRIQNGAVIVRFVAGYGTASSVPACVKNWMLIRIKTLYENRDQITVGTNGLVMIPSEFIDSLLDSERVYGAMFA